MWRKAFISTALSLLITSGLSANAVEAPEPASVDVRPMTRSSTDIFDVLTQFMRAKQNYVDQNYTESYKGFSAVILHDQENIEALMGLGNSALALGKPKVASKTFALLSKHNLTPEQKLGLMSGYALTRFISRSADNPEDDLHKALKANPTDPRLWNALGQFYDSQSSWDRSWSAYQSARAAGFNKAGFHNNLGMSFLQQQKYKGAISQFTYAVSLEPSNIQYDNNRRFALLMKGEYLEALNALDEDQSTKLLNDAGYIAMQKEEFTLARTLLEKAIEVSPTYNQQAAVNLEKLNLIIN